MIEKLLPLSRKKLEFLKSVYENQPTHLRKVSADTKIHPYLLTKIIDSLHTAKIIEQTKAGKTILLALNKAYEDLEQVTYIIEYFKQKTDKKVLAKIIKNTKAQFSNNSEILTCCLFGSYARGAESKDSDVDLLFVVRSKEQEKEITKKLSQLGTLLNIEFSPVIMDETEFKVALSTKEPTMVTLLKPSQRTVIFGIEFFLRSTNS
ncbi:nucleotidyltransferase domain-containing protein [Candidatus Woesearchaeota archaeon]|nr:nucleotidyltransferase domain-containing protein [Candidatus Woesearchaeota archaeon]